MTIMVGGCGMELEGERKNGQKERDGWCLSRPLVNGRQAI